MKLSPLEKIISILWLDVICIMSDNAFWILSYVIYLACDAGSKFRIYCLQEVQTNASKIHFRNILKISLKTTCSKLETLRRRFLFPPGMVRWEYILESLIITEGSLTPHTSGRVKIFEIILFTSARLRVKKKKDLPLNVGIIWFA